jgi:hypothetical protein
LTKFMPGGPSLAANIPTHFLLTSGSISYSPEEQI